jgi:hypothetical protein
LVVVLEVVLVVRRPISLTRLVLLLPLVMELPMVFPLVPTMVKSP